MYQWKEIKEKEFHYHAKHFKFKFYFARGFFTKLSKESIMHFFIENQGRFFKAFIPMEKANKQSIKTSLENFLQEQRKGA